jgi:hypothetical protein
MALAALLLRPDPNHRKGKMKAAAENWKPGQEAMALVLLGQRGDQIDPNHRSGSESSRQKKH